MTEEAIGESPRPVHVTQAIGHALATGQPESQLRLLMLLASLSPAQAAAAAD